ncbi:glycosyltransferase family 4 protein [Chamaesiphon sp. OTE_8_metabat_110]|uniref:glycosyltransferase family 4 protein n=1 Tax=Chamaesiphon sp. OTE_8_metabat_110 TaxID=2964696 RepID=UPI00286C70A9|nr:glycosyltransferase family 4 protein [Chamaesiphon sp. OTE_8_metabat_110]
MPLSESQTSMRVTLVIYGLGSGGAERVMSIIANYWVGQGWDVTLIMLVDPTKPPFYPLDPRVKIQSLGIATKSSHPLEAIFAAGWRVRVLRRAIVASQPDAIVSFMSAVNVHTILAGWNLNIPIIVSEHTYPGAIDINRIWQLLMKWSYRHADLVTVLTQNAIPFYPPAAGYQTIAIPNPILTPAPAIETARLLATPSLIAVGRLEHCKGFDLLLRAFHQLQAKYPQWQLTILGEGKHRAALEELRSQLALTDRVHFPGAVTNVREYLHQADLFVLSSRIEGFPMALCEAMACGLPVVAADCLSGPRDIIEDGVNGVLVATEDIAALVAGLDALMSDPARRHHLAQHAPQVLARFGLERVMATWTEAIEKSIYRRQYSQRTSKSL